MKRVQKQRNKDLLAQVSDRREPWRTIWLESTLPTEKLTPADLAAIAHVNALNHNKESLYNKYTK